MNPDSGRMEQAGLAARYTQLRSATEALAQGFSAKDSALRLARDQANTL